MTGAWYYVDVKFGPPHLKKKDLKHLRCGCNEGWQKSHGLKKFEMNFWRGPQVENFQDRSNLEEGKMVGLILRHDRLTKTITEDNTECRITRYEEVGLI